MRPSGWPQHKLTGVLIRRGRWDTRGKVLGRHSEKVATCTPRGRPSGETKPANTLILGFKPPELWEADFCCINRLVCENSLMVVLTWHPSYFYAGNINGFHWLSVKSNSLAWQRVLRTLLTSPVSYPYFIKLEIFLYPGIISASLVILFPFYI